MTHRNFRDHAVDRRAHARSAVRHQHRARADRPVKSFAQTALRSDIQITERLHPSGAHIRHRLRGKIIFFGRRRDDSCAGSTGAVGVEERALQIDDGFTAPLHHQAAFFRNDRNRRRFQVFFVRIAAEFVRIVCGDDHCHTFLRFGQR